MGHYVQIVTNGTPTKAFKILTGLPEDNQERIMIKFSFHYLELKRLKLFERFWNNVDSVRNSKMSFTVEITPSDELIPHIVEVKNMCEEKLNGAMPHITVCRDDRKAGIDILSNLSETEYSNVWGIFESELFDMKMKLYKRRIKEFCMAGVKSYSVNLTTGEINMCVAHPSIGNIYDLSKPLPACAVGNKCLLPYCFNGHAYLTLGICPEVKTPSMFAVRNRDEADGTHWVKEPLATVFKNRIC